MTETIGELLTAAIQRGEVRFSPDVERAVDDLFAKDVVLTDEQRQRFLGAADRALAWRRERIMGWRVALFTWRWALGWDDDWHAYFTCHRHGTSIAAPWTGPWVLGTDDGGESHGTEATDEG